MNKYIHTTLKGTLTAIMLMVGFSAWAQNVAKIDETEYETVAAAITAAGTSETTITIIADITENIAIPASANITLDLNGHTLRTASQHYTLSNQGTLRVIDNSVGKNAVVQGSPYVFRNDGTATIEGGTYNAVGSANTIVIGSNSFTTITGGTFTSVENTVLINGSTSGATLSISGGTFSATDNAVVAGIGTVREGDPNTINISGGIFNGSITSGGYIACGIYNPWKDNYNISGGTFNVTGGCGILARAGVVNITGGTFNCTGTTTGKVGDNNNYVPCAAVVLDSKANYPGLQEDAKITISDGTFKSDESVVSVQQIANDGDKKRIELSGGTFSTVDENFGNYLQSGYAVKTKSEEPTTYEVVAQTKTEVSESIQEGDAKTAAEDLAANTATATTEGLAYNQSLEISIENVTLEGSVVKTATFNVTPKDVNGNTIENASISAPITFRLPIPNTVAAGKWVNLKHDGTPIPASKVAADGDNRYVAVTTTSFSPFEYQVLLNDPVAQIGETKYETIAEAIAAAPESTETTIEILANITTDITIPAEKNIKLTIGTYTISGAITNAGTLAISDGTITGNITNSGTISITGGTFTNKPEAEWIAEDYEVMVGNGKFIVAAEGTAEAKIVVEEQATLYQTITDAIAAVSTEAEAEATTIVVLKDIDTAFEIPAEKKIALSITTHTISGNITNAGTLTISDGTFIGTITNNGTLNITGGTFTNKPNSYTCPDGKDLIINAEGKYEVTDIASAEAQIGDNMYLTIDDAISAAGETATTITLLKNPVAETITIPAVADITLQINNVASTFDALTKPINVEGKLAITSGTISGTTLTITNFSAKVMITAGVTHPAVALSTALQTENVLKSKAAGEPAVTTYWAEKKFEATIALTGAPTTEQTAAATALIANTSIKEVTGHATNQSLTIAVTSVTLDDASKVTKAEFEVKLIDTDGEEVTGTAPEVTFHLPIHSTIAGTSWVNLWHNTTAIRGMEVQGTTPNGYVTVTTTTFSPFSYEIIETPIAQIEETKYASVADAITAAPTSPAEATKIILVGTETDVEEAITVTENKDIKLTIGAHTVSGSLTNAGTLAIADGTISGTITNTGTLSVSGEANITGAVTASEGTLTISGGTLSSTITTSGTAALTISNGTMNGTLSVGGSGTNTISGGEFAEALTATAGTLNISGGTFNKDGDNAIYANTGTINITGGTFNNTTASAITPTSGSIHISGGTFNLAPVSSLCVAGYLPLINTAGKFDVKDRWDIVDDTDLSLNPHLAGGGYSVHTAEYQRHTGMISAGNAETMYGTICLPFAIAAQPSGMTLYKATSISGSTLTITGVDIYPVAAGTPLIFELSEAASNMTVTSTDGGGRAISVNTTAPATAPVTGNLLVGSYTAQNITTGLGSIYYLNGDKFHQAVSSLAVPAFRAYMDVTPVGSVKEFRLSISKDDGEATGIQQTAALEGVTEVYDMNGRKLNGLQRGVNIMRRADGSTIKVVVK